MRSIERKDLRDVLIAQGFHRVSATRDEGDGAYSETWVRRQDDQDVVVLQWGPRTPEPEPDLDTVLPWGTFPGEEASHD